MIYFPENIQHVSMGILLRCLAAGYSFENLKDPHPLNAKNWFQWLKTKVVAYLYPWGAHNKYLIAGSQPPDRGNKLAAE